MAVPDRPFWVGNRRSVVASDERRDMTRDVENRKSLGTRVQPYRHALATPIRLKWVAFGVTVATTIAYIAAITVSPLPLKVLDRDSSGIVSLWEASAAIDVGKRASADSPGCTEYFWLKDGLPAYIECPRR